MWQVSCLSTVARLRLNFSQAFDWQNVLHSEQVNPVCADLVKVLIFFVESSLCQRVICQSLQRVLSPSAHMQTLVFACFLRVVGVTGVGPAHADCV